MKIKPGTLVAQGGLAAALVLLLSACAAPGACTPAPTAEQTPAAGSGAEAASEDETAAPASAPTPTPTPAPAPATAYTVPAAGGTPQASPAVPPPDYSAPPPAEALSSAPPTGAQPDVVVPDATVAANVKSALASHNTTRGLRIHVAVDNGVVKLTGVVPSSVQSDQAVSVIDDVQGVKEVNNLLKVGK